MPMTIAAKARDLWNAAEKTFKSWPRSKRIIWGSVGGFVVVLFSLYASAEYTSRPAFCPTCHYMEPYYESWKAAEAHADVSCAKCHFPPGIAGTVKGKIEGLVQVVNYLSSSYTRRKPWAEIDDASCMQSGCHDTALEGRVDFNGVVFDHGPHLSGLRRGKQLRCTSCHSQIVQGDHIRVTETTCFLCHLKEGGEVVPADFAKLSNCTTCHHWDSPDLDPEAELTQFHRNVLDRNIDCKQCHANTIVGDGFVPHEACFGCHAEQDRLDQVTNTDLLHSKHIADNKIECVQCHLQIQHKVQRVDPAIELQCSTCHQGTHREQVMLYTGNIGVGNVAPSPMFEAGIDCSGCHAFHETALPDTDAGDRIARAQSCENCHGEGYNRLLGMWSDGARSKLAEFRSNIDKVSAAVRGAGGANRALVDSSIVEARKILHVVEIGKPVHNVTYYDQLIRAGYDRLQEAAKAASRSVSLPEYTVASNVPGSCANCHTGVERRVVDHDGTPFDHGKHVEDQGLSCATCHSNASRHGLVIKSAAQCNACHHEEKRAAETTCATCHDEVASIYDGSFEGVGTPDIMADADVACQDCHVSGGKILKPLLSTCADCHDDEYPATGEEWRTEVTGLLAEVQTLLQAVPAGQRSSAEYQKAQRVADALTRFGAGGIHNYELSSGLLISSRKALQGMAASR